MNSVQINLQTTSPRWVLPPLKRVPLWQWKIRRGIQLNEPVSTVNSLEGRAISRGDRKPSMTNWLPMPSQSFHKVPEAIAPWGSQTAKHRVVGL